MAELKQRNRYKSTDQWEIMLPRLVELNAAGQSGNQIMIALNIEFGFEITRSAVMGKLHREHLRQPAPHKNAQVIVRRTKEKRDRGAPMWINYKTVSIVDLAQHHCRWVIGEPRDMRYCGADRKEPLSYCEHHARIAYNGTSSGGSKHFTQPRRSRAIVGYT